MDNALICFFVDVVVVVLETDIEKNKSFFCLFILLGNTVLCEYSDELCPVNAVMSRRKQCSGV